MTHSIGFILIISLSLAGAARVRTPGTATLGAKGQPEKTPSLLQESNGTDISSNDTNISIMHLIYQDFKSYEAAGMTPHLDTTDQPVMAEFKTKVQDSLEQFLDKFRSLKKFDAATLGECADFFEDLGTEISHVARIAEYQESKKKVAAAVGKAFIEEPGAFAEAAVEDAGNLQVARGSVTDAAVDETASDGAVDEAALESSGSGCGKVLDESSCRFLGCDAVRGPTECKRQGGFFSARRCVCTKGCAVKGTWCSCNDNGDCGGNVPYCEDNKCKAETRQMIADEKARCLKTENEKVAHQRAHCNQICSPGQGLPCAAECHNNKHFFGGKCAAYLVQPLECGSGAFGTNCVAICSIGSKSQCVTDCVSYPVLFDAPEGHPGRC